MAEKGLFGDSRHGAVQCSAVRRGRVDSIRDTLPNTTRVVPRGTWVDDPYGLRSHPEEEKVGVESVAIGKKTKVDRMLTFTSLFPPTPTPMVRHP